MAFVTAPLAPRAGGVRRVSCPVRSRRAYTPSVRPVTPVCMAAPTAAAAFANAVAASLDPAMFRTAVSAISRLLTTVCLGVVAARKGLLDKDVLSSLSKTVYFLFLPAVLLTNVVKTMAAGGAGYLFWLPVAAVVQIGVGAFFGLLGGKALKLTPPEKRVFLVSCGFGNSAALPLLFASALFSQQPALLGAMVSSISFYLLGWSGTFWSAGYHMLATAPSDDGEEKNSALGDKPVASLRERVLTITRRIFSPPMIASCLGLIIGAIAPLRSLFMASPVFPAMSTLGSGYALCAVLILAGSLARRTTRSGLTKSTVSSNNEPRPFRMARMVLGISLTRYIIMPLVGVAMALRAGAFLPPMVRFVLMLQCLMPPAQNQTLILNLEGKADAATAVARILMVVYSLGVVPLSVGLTIILGLSGV